MKKIIFAVLLLVGISSFAQEQTDKKLNKPKREKLTPEQREQAMLDRMTKELSLTAQQQEQVKPIIAEQNAKLQSVMSERAEGNSKKMTTEERETLKAKRKEEKKATEAKLQSILTPEQFTKMKSNEAANREKMRQLRENRGNREKDNGGMDNGDNNDMN